MAYNQQRSWAWFLLPIFLGIFGGLIAYFMLRQYNDSMAKNCLYLGAALTAVFVGIGVIGMSTSTGP